MPPLPPEYTLDKPAGIPPLPPGYKLDRPPTLVPVDHDPFATTAGTRTSRLIQFEGRQISVPHDATDAEISAIFQGSPLPPRHRPVQPAGIPPLPPGYKLDQPPKFTPVDHDPFSAFQDAPPVAPAAPPSPPISGPDRTPGGVPIGPNGLSRVTISPQAERPPSLLPSSVGGAVRDFTVGAQGVGKGISHIVTGPFDLAAGAQNAVTAGINKVFGTNIPSATPASKLAEQGVDKLNLPLINSATMSKSEKLPYDMSDYATQALGVGSALATRAPEVLAQTTRSPTFTSRTLDTMARPYKDAPARTLVGDMIGGIGAGVAVNAADNYVPEHPVGGDWIKSTANVVAPLVGGMGANTIQGAAEGVAGMLRNIATRAFTSAPREIPLNPATKAPYSNSDVDRAATKLQASATGSPAALAQDIRENASALSRPLALSCCMASSSYRLDRRDLVWIGVTTNPTAKWVARQFAVA